MKTFQIETPDVEGLELSKIYAEGRPLEQSIRRKLGLTLSTKGIIRHSD